MNLYSSLIVFTISWSLAKCQMTCNPPGWFRQGCKYRCRCENNMCDQEGRCEPNSKCSKGWFGEYCQYQDLASLQGVRITTNTEQETGWLVDSDDNTCNNDQQVQFISITWDTPFRFTWLVLKLKNDTPSDSNSAHLTFTTSQSGNEQCRNKQQSFVNPYTMTILCDLTLEVSEVKITGTSVRSVCSIYVSGGRNVALRQTTSQSSNFSVNSESHMAVDGETNGNFAGNSCTHTEEKSKITQSWTMTFDSPVIVNRFLIHNRNDCCYDRLKTFSLETHGKGDAAVQIYNNDDSVKHMYRVPVPYDKMNEPLTSVIISSGKSTILTLCEVEAYGDCPPGKWGLECNKDCPYSCSKTCNQETGSCNYCHGYSNPPYCTEVCLPGKHGKNCLETCPTNCDTNARCDAFTGNCKVCKPGFLGHVCNNSCFPKNFGLNCQNDCPINCRNQLCNHVNGSCYICEPGYQGIKCDQDCNLGYYGINCQYSCPATCSQKRCNHVNGACESCVSGFQGDMCQQVCSPKKFGLNCQNDCPINCRNQLCNREIGSCSSCEPGYQGIKCDQDCNLGRYGMNCQYSCPGTCSNKRCNHVSGSCESCISGYQGAMCQQVCSPNTYGVNCSFECSTRCRDNMCSATEGVCLSCYPGYQGQLCDQICNATYYGQDCVKKCNTSCMDHLCDPVIGSCYNCPIGRQGDQCDFCPTGSFGEGCLSDCSANCLGGNCHLEEGTCLQGCKDGFDGDMCNLSCPTGHYGVNCSLQCSHNCSDSQCISTNMYCFKLHIEGVANRKIKDLKSTVIGIGSGLGVSGAVIIYLLFVIMRGERELIRDNCHQEYDVHDNYESVDYSQHYETASISKCYKNVPHTDETAAADCCGVQYMLEQSSHYRNDAVATNIYDSVIS